jgi:hypothetical protein
MELTLTSEVKGGQLQGVSLNVLAEVCATLREGLFIAYRKRASV